MSAPSDLQDEKETAACAEEKLRALAGYGELPEPTSAGAPTLPRGPAPPERSSGEDSAVLRRQDSPSPRWSGRRTGAHLHISAVLGRHGRPAGSPGKPRAKGQWMNELPARPNPLGHGQPAGGLTCADAGRLLRVCAQAGTPELEQQLQQQQLQLHPAAPHLRPGESAPAPAARPPSGGSLLARARGPRSARGDDCGRDPGAKCARRRRGGWLERRAGSRNEAVAEARRSGRPPAAAGKL